ALGMRGILARHWRHVLDESDEAMTRSGSRLSFFSSSTKSVRLFLQSAILGLGAWMAVEGVSTAGAMIAASILMGRAIAPVEQLVGQWRQISNVREAARALNETVKDNLDAAADKMELPPLTGRMSMEKVSLVLPGDDEPILRNIDFALEPGDVLGIIGPSGSGKSSIARLLVGVWSATSGAVRFDGAEISTYDQGRLGPQIGYLPQEVKLFSGTAKDNIARFDAQPAPEGIISAAMAAGCHDLILGFDGGYETQLGAGGVYLSAGQRQRLGLARALYGAPNFVVLDEPNSNLDVDGDSALEAAIDGLRKRKAVTVIIAHRAGILQKCTKLLAIAKGKTAVFGPRDEVLSKLVPPSAPAKSAPKQPGRVTALRKAPSRA
ncbi:MAG: ATP-binding cassette domain-containing protein, partial [Pseudomonadota bacterium]